MSVNEVKVSRRSVPASPVAGAPLVKSESGSRLRELSKSLSLNVLRASQSVTVAWSIVTCLMDGGGSASMAFLNKGLLSSLDFNFTFILLLLQMIFAVLVLSALRAAGAVQFKHPISLALCGALTPMSLAYTLNAALGLASLQGLSLPMFSVLKRMTPMLTVLLDYALHRKLVSRPVLASLALVTVGTVIAGFGDLVFDWQAYVLALSSCLTQSLYLLWSADASKRYNMSADELTFYNSLLSILPLLPAVLLSGEVAGVLVYPRYNSPSFLLSLSTMMVLGSSLNYLMFLCTSTNSALTTTVVGVFKSMLQTVAGFFVLGGAPFSVLNIAGCVINALGGFGYAMAKYREQQLKEQSKASYAPVKQLPV